MSDDKNKKNKSLMDRRIEKLDKKGEIIIEKKTHAAKSEFTNAPLPKIDMTEDELDSKVYNSKLYHRKISMSFLEELLELMKVNALKGDTFCMKYFIQRSLRPENDVVAHKFDGLVGVNSMNKISQACELVLQAVGEGKLTYKESNELFKSLSIYSQHLRDTQQLDQMSENIEKLTETIIKLCEAANLEEPDELKKVIKSMSKKELDD